MNKTENISIQPARGKKSLYDLKLYIDSKELPWNNIKSLTIREYVYDVIPRFKLSFTDDGFFSTDNPLCENQIIEIIASYSDSGKNIINQKFKIVTYERTNLSSNVDNVYIFVVEGIIYTDAKVNRTLYNKSYKQKTFSEVVENIASLSGINSNVEITSKDRMNWFQTNKSNTSFLNESIYKSSVGDNDTPFCYIDRHSVLNYTSLQTAVKKDTNLILTYSPTEMSKGNIDNNSTQRYFTSYTYTDLSGYFNTYGGGNGIKYSYYNESDFVTKNSAEYKSSGLTKYINKVNDSVQTQYLQFGTYNQGNLYEDYFDTLVRNQILRGSILSNNLVISAQPNHYNLLDKINIEIKSKSSSSNVQKPNSGNYLIGGIVHNFSNSGQYAQMLVCFRDGMDGADTYNNFVNPLKKA